MALYQAANPNSWLQPEYVDGDKDASTFWIPKGVTIDTKWPLPPFWKGENTLYTSEDVRWTPGFGYAYPETQYWKFPTEDQWRNDVRGTIQKLYSNSVRMTLTAALNSGDTLFQLPMDDSTFLDWSIETSISIAKMPKSFKVEFSLKGDSPTDQETRIGMWVRMTSADQEESESRDEQAAYEADIRNTAHRSLSNHQSLTSGLLDRIKDGRLQSLNPDAVIPYIKDHLAWNVYAVRRFSSCSLL